MNQTALITGASGGIGKELAIICAKNKYSLVLVARSQDKLQTLQQQLSNQYHVHVTVLVKDLSKPTAPQEIYDEVSKSNLHIDILINNAGFGQYGQFALVDFTKQRELLQVNIFALTELTRLFLPDMIKNKSGKIMNIASTAGFLPGPLMATYYASKAYVVSFSQAIANELKGSGVTVTCLCPGITKTGFATRAGVENTRAFSKIAVEASTVAEIGFKAMLQGKSLEIVGSYNKVMIFLLRFAPRQLVTKIIRYMQNQRTS